MSSPIGPRLAHCRRGRVRVEGLSQEEFMNTIGVLLLAAATATTGIGKPHVGGKKLLRPHAVVHGAPPAGGMIGGPGMGAPGACAFGHPGCAGGPTCPGAGGMGMGAGMGGQAGRRFPNVRSQLFFVDPPGMKIGWQTAAGGGERVYLPAQLSVPARYNFTQGYIYRLKLTDIPGRPGLTLYPTLEVAPSTPATDAYLTHNPIPVQFTEEDFDQVQAGNFVTKVIYLPDPKYQELAISGVETLVSTRLEPGVDPILEADKRGTILLIVRLGGIDLEMQHGVSAPAMVTEPAGSTAAPFAAPVEESVPVDNTTPAAPEAAPTAPGGVSPVPSQNVPPTPAPNTPEAAPPDANPASLEVPSVPGLNAPEAPDLPAVEAPGAGL